MKERSGFRVKPPNVTAPTGHSETPAPAVNERSASPSYRSGIDAFARAACWLAVSVMPLQADPLRQASTNLDQLRRRDPDRWYDGFLGGRSAGVLPRVRRVRGLVRATSNQAGVDRLRALGVETVDGNGRIVTR